MVQKLTNICLKIILFLFRQGDFRYPASRSIDGNLNNFWHSAVNQRHLVWLKIDVGDVYDIQKILVVGKRKKVKGLPISRSILK